MPQHFESHKGLTWDEAVLKLNKSIYGLVQSPMYCFNHHSTKLENKGFKASDHDPCMFYGHGSIILVYVDDCLFFGPDSNKIDMFIDELQKDGMQLTKEDDAFHFLGIEVIKHKDGRVELLQNGLIKNVLNTLNMANCHEKEISAAQVPLGTDTNRKPFNEDLH